MLKFICYPKCTTCQKAKKWLDDNKIEYELRDIKLNNPTLDEFQPYDLVRVDPESVPEGYRTENIYGFPHGHLLIK